MSAPSTSGLSVELLLRVIDVKYGCFTLLYFTPPCFSQVAIEGVEFEIVSSAKVLGVVISSDLKWSAHIDSITTKAAKRLNLLRQLKRVRIAHSDLVSFYCSVIRSILEYACQVVHCNVPLFLSEEIERIQRRAFRVIFPDCSYSEGLAKAGPTTLCDRRSTLCKELFSDIDPPGNHKLSHLLPVRSQQNYNLRSTRAFDPPVCKKKQVQRQLYH